MSEQTQRNIEVIDFCTVCTHSRTQHLRGRFACLYVIDEQAACSCVEFIEPRPTREVCEHGWRGTLPVCPRCQMAAPTDWFSTFMVMLILACNAFFGLMVACIVFRLI